MNPELKEVATPQGGVFSRGQAVAAGYSPEQMRERLGDGRWERVRHGQYVEATDLSGLARWDREALCHRRAVHAVMNSFRGGSVAVSHQSALVLHELSPWGVDLDEVQVNRMDDRKGRVRAGVREHGGKLSPLDLTEVSGLLVTTVPRAVVELACRCAFEPAVVAVDAALRRKLIGEEELARLVDVTEFWPGGPGARAALAFGSRLSESAGESRLRVLIHNHGLPTPIQQYVFKDAAGFVARVDFYFPGQRTVLEFDGLVKYADGSAEVLVQEKLREDRLRALGVEVVRITWADLARPQSVVARLREAFARAGRAA
ncbi:MAG: hypothetical protein QOH84_4643 [Kribbellaceae bacterium]|nr:hypothetical protein [Kribbellaceae bacterium]